jgi:hypothetical protein
MGRSRGAPSTRRQPSWDRVDGSMGTALSSPARPTSSSDSSPSEWPILSTCRTRCPSLDARGRDPGSRVPGLLSRVPRLLPRGNPANGRSGAARRSGRWGSAPRARRTFASSFTTSCGARGPAGFGSCGRASGSGAGVLCRAGYLARARPRGVSAADHSGGVDDLLHISLERVQAPGAILGDPQLMGRDEAVNIGRRQITWGGVSAPSPGYRGAPGGSELADEALSDAQRRVAHPLQG